MIQNINLTPFKGVYGLAWLQGRKPLFVQENGVYCCQNKSHVIGRSNPRPNMSLHVIFEVFVEFTANETPFMAVNSSVWCSKVFQGLEYALMDF